MAGKVMQRNQLDFTVPSDQTYKPYQQGIIQKSLFAVPNDVIPKHAHYHQNQLQFNLDAPADPTNLTTRSLKPGPIVIEKLGSPHRTRDHRPRFSPLKFSVISEDKMSLAMRLVKRDIKRKLLGQGFNIAQYHEMESPKKTKVTYSKEYKQKLKQKKAKEKTKSSHVKLEERFRGSDVKSSETQTSRPKLKDRHLRSTKVKDSAKENTVQVHMQRPYQSSRIDGAAYPERDTDSPATKQAKEIRRLRKELRYYIQKIDQLSTKDDTVDEDKILPVKPDVTSDGEMAARKLSRQSEQASRNARLLYALQQQVREIQDELIQTGPDSVSHSQKSRTLTRLAAAHRGAVRALQTFIHHMPSHPDSKSGLPKVYNELSALIKQLSMVCAQLEIGESGVPDMILKVPKNEHELFSHQLRSPSFISDSDFMSSKHGSRRQLLGDFHDSQFNSHPERELWEGRNDWLRERVKQKKKKNKKKTKQIKSTPLVQETLYQRPGIKTVDRLRQDVARQRAESHDTPERDAAIRAGIAALLRAADESGRREPPKPRKSQAKYAATKHKPVQSSHPTVFKPSTDKTSVLLPQNLRFKKTIKPTIPDIDHPHFTEATVASKMKVKTVHREPYTEVPDPRPIWSPPGSPSSKAKGVRPVGELSLLGDLGSGIRSPRRLCMDPSIGMSPVKHTYKNKEALTDAEETLKNKLQPILDQADEIADKYRELQRTTQQSLRYNLSERASQAAAANAELLSEMLLEDILLDTAKEFQKIENDNEMEQRAIAIQEAPTVENLLQRLERMETEEDRIRQRWNQVQYVDPEKRHSLTTTDRQNVPSSTLVYSQPEPIHMSSKRADYVATATDEEDDGLNIKPVDGDRLERCTDDEVPMYTSLHFSRLQPELSKHAQSKDKRQVKDDNTEQKKNLIPLFLPSESMQRINDYREKFDDHLKRTSTQSYGSFDPWKLVSELADEIVDDLFDAVTKEMGDVCESYVDGVYTAEFNKE
ncbi:protein moonraker-like [Saccoglossus kowalevskii]|uniref:Uncharacterized protein KIAA0753-like n=1 Tax=Saccoglossus kowalevskii TaxID=10224 RepID=A0ABM0GVW5_SACKO|nr:PREDICTED: uncharacterized protein KIAA0753-like [Saccoglossus kowalevskii]